MPEYSNYLESLDPIADVDVTGDEIVGVSKDGDAKSLTAQQIADLAGGGGAVDSVNGATGVVVLDAGDIAFTPAGTISSTTVQGAIEEVAAEAGGGAVDSVNGATGVVVLDAGDIGNTAAGNIAATTVQAAINELDAEKQNILISFRTLTASHTLDSTDLASINGGATLNILMNVAGANDLIIPPNATIAFPVGTVILIDQIGAGATTIVAGSGVTVRNTDGLVLAGQYAGAYAKKLATNEWYAQGKLKL